LQLFDTIDVLHIKAHISKGLMIYHRK
jgi:uncharacterized membrane protein YqaE (UPF0057 family)